MSTVACSVEITGRNCTGSRTPPPAQVTDEQWVSIARYFVDPPQPKGGRPRVPARQCLEGVLWILQTGARWKDLPERYPSPSTCWRRLKEWTESGVFRLAWEKLLGKLDGLRGINWEQAIGDGTFSPAKKGGAAVGKTKKGKGTKVMLLVDGDGLPLGVHIAGANEAEVDLIEDLIDFRTIEDSPQRLIYDRAADCDPLRERLTTQHIELICPHRKNRKRPATQDGRPLRRYRHRYKVERSISWLFNHRRLVVRYEHLDHLYLGFLQLACMLTILRRF